MILIWSKKILQILIKECKSRLNLIRTLIQFLFLIN